MTFGSLPALTKSAAGLGALVLAVAIAAVSSWVTRWAVDQDANGVTDTVRVETPLAPGEIVEATMPDQVTQYDTSETRTECIQVPIWLGNTPQTPAGETPRPDKNDGDNTTENLLRSSITGSRLSQSSQRLAGPPYVTIPVTQGSPSLSVGSDAVRLSGYLPSGEGREWEYDLPTDRWGVGLRSDFTFSKWVQVTTTLGVTRHAEWGPLDVQARFGVGYGLLVRRQSVEAAPAIRSSFRLTYNW